MSSASFPDLLELSPLRVILSIPERCMWDLSATAVEYILHHLPFDSSVPQGSVDADMPRSAWSGQLQVVGWNRIIRFS